MFNHIKSLIIAMVATLAITSCSESEMLPSVHDDTVEFTVKLPGSAIGSRALGDGYTATTLRYAVYKGTELILDDEATFAAASLTTKLSLQLAKGVTYKVVFFAAASVNGKNADATAATAYTFNAVNGTVSVNYANMKQDADAFIDYDCFAAVENMEVSGPAQKSVTLTRPMAQINWGTNDLGNKSAIKAFGGNAESVTAPVVTKFVGKAYSTLSLLSEEVSVSNEVNVESPMLNPIGNEKFPVSSYDYLNSMYLLMPSSEGYLADCNLELYKAGETETLVSTVKVTNVPLQANYRTNIYGALLTSALDINVDKDPTWDEPGNDVPVPTVYVATAEELAGAFAKGGNIGLTDDITLATANTISATKPTNIVLNGHTLTVSKTQTLAEGASLSIEGSKIGTRADVTDRGKVVAMVSAFVANNDGTSLYFKDIDFEGKCATSGNTLIALFANNVIARIDNCTFAVNDRTYAIGTNASEPVKTGIEVVMNNVTVKQIPGKLNACATLFNVPEKVIASNCLFESCNTSIILRGGEFEFINCEFVQTLAIDASGAQGTTKDGIKTSLRNYNRSVWGNGNNVPLAGIIVGNHSNGYQYPTNLKMTGCTVTIPEVAQIVEGKREESLPAMYVYANAGEGLGVTVTYDNATTFNGEKEYASGNITVNGVAITEPTFED